MTPRQQKFVDEYLIDLNATQAAIRAGYSKKTAQEQASRLLSNVMVAQAVAERRKASQEAAVVTRERVLRELAAVGMSDIRKLYDANGNIRPIHELDDETAASIAGVETEELFEGRGEDREHIGHVRKVKRFDKTKALELLGRHLGLWESPEKPPEVGPGLTVIVQQGVQVDGQRVTQAARVSVNLPPPR